MHKKALDSKMMAKARKIVTFTSFDLLCSSKKTCGNSFIEFAHNQWLVKGAAQIIFDIIRAGTGATKQAFVGACSEGPHSGVRGPSIPKGG